MLTIIMMPPRYNLFTLEANNAIQNASAVIVQTRRSGAYEGIVKNSMKVFTLDDFFENADSFISLYEDGAKYIYEMAQDKDVVFCALGSPYENGFIQKLDALMPYTRLFSYSNEDYARFLASGILGNIACYTSIDCRKLKDIHIDTSLGIIITGIENDWVIEEVKLELLNFYSVEQNIVLLKNGNLKSMNLGSLSACPFYKDGLTIVIPPVDILNKDILDFYDLKNIMNILRSDNGCPWDIEQTHETLRPYLIEEAYEVMDAIDADNMPALYDELGDVLLQVVFHAEIAKQSGEFELSDVTTSICKKLIMRHPHVFANIITETADEVVTNWESIKRGEKGFSAVTDSLKDVPRSMGALMRAAKIQKKAATTGFDWKDEQGALLKVEEEIHEFKEALKNNCEKKLEEEGGDLLFSVVNLLRKKKINPEMALLSACEKFIKRFAYIEQNARVELNEMTLEEMDSLWCEAKENETGKT